MFKEFIRLYSEKNDLAPVPIPQNQIERLQLCSWPGNVRQLQNFTERLVLLSKSQFDQRVFEKIFNEFNEQILTSPFQALTQQKETITHSVAGSEINLPEDGEKTYKEKINQITLDNERQFLQTALENARFSKSRAAKGLGISRSTLWKKMKKVGLN